MGVNIVEWNSTTEKKKFIFSLVMIFFATEESEIPLLCFE